MPDPDPAAEPDTADLPAPPADTRDLPPGLGAFMRGLQEMAAGDTTGPHPTVDLALPEVPGYVVAGEIARGGMGRVLAAHDLALGRDVAVKVLLGHRADGNGVRRFVREAEITARLPHPGIPPVHALGELPVGGPFLAMKLVRGRTLADLLHDRAGPDDDLTRFVGVFEQVCQAVGFAHAQGVVHRDLKPANVMVGEFGEVQVMDWGLAKQVGRPSDDPPEPRVRTVGPDDGAATTKAGAVLGTPAYIAPEQARGEPVDARADVFSLGALLLEILTGAWPYGRESAAVILARAADGRLDEAWRRLGECRADPELVAVARQCLAPAAADRPADAGAVAGLVAAYRAGVEDRLRKAEADRAAAAAKAAERRRRRRAQAALGGLVAAVLFVGLPAAVLSRVRLAEVEELAGLRTAAADAARRGANDARRAEAEARRAEDQAVLAARESQRAETAARRAADTQTYFGILSRVGHAAADHKPGWAFDNLDALTRAAGMTDLPARDLLELRAAAATALAAPDLREVATAARDVLASAVAFSRDGKRLAVAESRAQLWAHGRVLLVNPDTGATERTLSYTGVPASRNGVLTADGGRELAFSPDGRWLYLGCSSGRVHRWDLNADPPTLFSWTAHEKDVVGLVSPTGSTVYTSSDDGTVRRWVVKPAGVERGRLDADPSWPVRKLLVHPAGVWRVKNPWRLLADREGIQILDPDTLQPGGSVPRTAVAPSKELGSLLAGDAVRGLLVTGNGPEIGVVDSLVRRLVRSLTDPDDGGKAHLSGQVTAAAVSPDGAMLATVGRGGDLKVWDLPAGRVAARVFLGETHAVAFAPVGRRLAVVADRRTVVYEFGGGAERTTLAPQPRVVRGFGQRADGRLVTLAGGRLDPDAYWNHLAEWRPTGVVRHLDHWQSGDYGHHAVVRPFADGMLFADNPGTLRWEETAGVRVPPLEPKGVDPHPDYALVVDRPGRRLWLVQKYTVTVYPNPGQAPLAAWTNTLGRTLVGQGKLVSVDAGDRWAAVGGDDGSVRLLRYVEPKPGDGAIDIAAVWAGRHGPVGAVAFSPDETLVAAGAHKGRVVVRTVPGGEVVADLPAHDDRVTGVAFSPDGALLATGSRDRRVRVWRRIGGGFEPVVTLAPVGASGVRQLAFAPDGVRLLVLHDREACVRCWHLDKLNARLTAMNIGW